MRKVVSIFVAAALLFGAGLSHSRAAETKLVAAVAIAGYNDLLDNVNFIGSLVERPQLGAALDGTVTLLTEGKGLAGVDKTRPWGAIVQASGEADFSAYVFVPVTDFKQALGLLELYSTVAAEGGIYKLTPKDGKDVAYVKQQGTWAFFAEKPEMLAHCDANPLASLGNLKKDYVLGGRVFLANVPAGLRTKFIAGLKKDLEEAIAQQESESEGEFTNRKKVLQQIEAYAVRVAGDLDQVVFGWALDRTAGETVVDVNVTAKPGTKTAQEMALAAKATTNFAGFRVPGAALTCGAAGALPPATRDIAAGAIDGLRGKALVNVGAAVFGGSPVKALFGGPLVKGLVNDSGDLLQKIVKRGRVDGAASVLLGPKGVTGLAAGFVADGALLDKILRAAAQGVVVEHPELAQAIKFDVEKSRGVSFHSLSIPLPADAADVQPVTRLFGEKLDIIVGVGKETAYLAVGRDALATLKKAINGSAGAKAASPLEISLAAAPVASFAAAAGEPGDRPQAAMMEAELKKTPGKDRAILAVRPIANGLQLHLEIEQGLLRLFGRLAAMGMEQK
jgi:hypothetical protein